MQKEPMTAYGYAKLSKEFEYLKNVERPSIVKEIEIAAEHGDFKENAEYHAAKEKQRLLDEQLMKMSDMLGKAQIIDPSTLAHERVSFGSTVELCDLKTNETVTYTIVGGVESAPARGLISFASPMSKVLLGKEEGDEIKAHLPSGVREFEVISVRYEEITFEN
ncbi:MAG: transcription elongation factor GreA [Sulfuricurvum sp. PC08-66]|nr:MAG: transcription elongation factor GreA [Sulfuricurvum sp. PC08-66]